MAVEKDGVGNIDGAGQISRILRERFAPDATDRIFQDMVKSSYLKRSGQNMCAYLMEFGALRQEGEARMTMGSGCPDECVSALRMQNAALTKNGKT